MYHPVFNPFTPEVLKWTFPSLNLGIFIVANGGVIQVKTGTANRIDPDEMAHYKPSHQDLLCLQRYMFWSTGQKVTVKVTL